MRRKTIPQQKGGLLRMKKTLVALPEDLHKALKHYAVEHETQMKDVVAEAIRRYLGIKEGGASGKK
jgi:hypothetical protein